MTSGVRRGLTTYAGILVGIVLVPLIVVLGASMTSGGFVAFPPARFGLDWYGRVMDTRGFVEAFAFSVQTASVVAAGGGTLGLLSGLAIHGYRFPGRAALIALIMAPLMMPHIVLAVGLLQLFSSIGVPTSPYALVLGQTVVVLPFVMRMVLGGLGGIDSDLGDASYSLGASPWRTLRKVTLPLVAPALIAGVTFAFILSFEEGVISIFTSLPEKTTIPVMIFNYVEQRSDPLVTAASGIMVLGAFTAALIIDRAFGLLKLLSGHSVPSSGG